MTLSEQKKLMIEYMKLKMAEEDWHGVCDAANDLRELEVAIKLIGQTISLNDWVCSNDKFAECGVKDHRKLLSTEDLERALNKMGNGAWSYDAFYKELGFK